MGPPWRQPIAPWANALTTELHLAPPRMDAICNSGDLDNYAWNIFVFISKSARLLFTPSGPLPQPPVYGLCAHDNVENCERTLRVMIYFVCRALNWGACIARLYRLGGPILWVLAHPNQGARCSSVVKAFAHGAMGRRINPSLGGPIELFLVPASAPRLV